IPFPGFEDQDIADCVKCQLDVVKNKRNRSFLIDHIRFPVSSREGFTLTRGDSYDVTECEYNKERLLHLTREPRQPGGCKLKTAPVRPVVAARPAEYVCSEDLFY
ncbi:hypothetical protein ACW7VZ_005051, partial [Escherichia coli]